MEKPKIVLIDFEFYNRDKLMFFKSKKMEFIEIQDFESAARYRTLENECQEYIDIKEGYGIQKINVFL